MAHRNPPTPVVWVGVALLTLALPGLATGRVGLGPPSDAESAGAVSTADTESTGPVLVGQVTREEPESEEAEEAETP